MGLCGARRQQRKSKWGLSTWTVGDDELAELGHKVGRVEGGLKAYITTTSARRWQIGVQKVGEESWELTF